MGPVGSGGPLACRRAGHPARAEKPSDWHAAKINFHADPGGETPSTSAENDL